MGRNFLLSQHVQQDENSSPYAAFLDEKDNYKLSESFFFSRPVPLPSLPVDFFANYYFGQAHPEKFKLHSNNIFWDFVSKNKRAIARKKRKSEPYFFAKAKRQKCAESFSNTYVFLDTGELISTDCKVIASQNGRSYCLVNAMQFMPGISLPIETPDVAITLSTIREVTTRKAFFSRTFLIESDNSYVPSYKKKSIIFDKEKNALTLDGKIVLPKSNLVYEDGSLPYSKTKILKDKQGVLHDKKNHLRVISKQEYLTHVLTHVKSKPDLQPAIAPKLPPPGALLKPIFFQPILKKSEIKPRNEFGRPQEKMPLSLRGI